MCITLSCPCTICKNFTSLASHKTFLLQDTCLLLIAYHRLFDGLIWSINFYNCVETALEVQKQVCLFFVFFYKTEFYLPVFSILMSTFNLSNSSPADKCLTNMAMTEFWFKNFFVYSLKTVENSFKLIPKSEQLIRAFEVLVSNTIFAKLFTIL